MEEELTEDRAPPLMKEDSKTTVERVIDECSGPVLELLLKHEDLPFPKTAPVSKLKKDPTEIEEQVIDELEALDGLAELFNPTAHDAHESKATLHIWPAEYELRIFHEDLLSPKTAPVSKLKKDPTEIEEQVIDELEALDGLAELFNPTAHDAHESKAALHTKLAEHELMSWKTCIEALEEYFKMSEWLWGDYVDTTDDDTEYETADETDNNREDEVDSEPDSEMDTEADSNTDVEACYDADGETDYETDSETDYE